MSGPSVTVRVIGARREPVAVIDGFAPDPEALRSAAATAAWRPAGDHYPGIAAPVPPDYLARQRPLLATVLSEVFGVGERVRVLDLRFAMVTTPPETLGLAQRLPHVDATEPGRLALVHFLAPGGAEGTGFFRHRASGLEAIEPANEAAYFARLRAECATPPIGYPDGDTALFERIAAFEGRYNRALLYRSHLLHSGLIPPGTPLSDDPRAGRLTITGFFAS